MVDKIACVLHPERIDGVKPADLSATLNEAKRNQESLSRNDMVRLPDSSFRSEQLFCESILPFHMVCPMKLELRIIANEPGFFTGLSKTVLNPGQRSLQREKVINYPFVNRTNTDQPSHIDGRHCNSVAPSSIWRRSVAS